MRLDGLVVPAALFKFRIEKNRLLIEMTAVSTSPLSMVCKTVTMGSGDSRPRRSI
jgi:hypothetical protein